MTVLAELEAAGLHKPTIWPARPVEAGLGLVESFLSPGDGNPRLLIHPRCTHLIEAFRCYRRARRRGQLMDCPEDPQHPYEDVMDALRGGLVARFPEGRGWGEDRLVRAPARWVL